MELSEKVYQSLYDRFWRITNNECQVNDFSVRGIAFVSLADLNDFGLEPDQAMEVQSALETLRDNGQIRRLTEEEEAALLKHLRDEGVNPKEFLDNKDYLLYVGPN